MDRDEKNRIFEMTMKKIEKEEQKKKVIKFPKWKVVGTVAASFAVLLLAGTAGAKLFHWDTAFSNYFRTDNPDSKVVTEHVRRVSVSDTVGGVEIKANQVVGDDTGCYAVLQIKNPPAYIGELSFKNTTVVVDGCDELVWDEAKQLGTDDDGSISFMVRLRGSNLTKKKIHLELKNLGYKDEKEHFVTLKKGSWQLDWILDYENDAKTITAAKKVDLWGSEANWDSVTISPLSVQIHYTITKQSKESGFTEKEYSKYEGSDRLVVQFMDGSRMDSRFISTGGDDFEQHNGVSCSMGFHKIVDLSEIESISYAGQTIVINENKNPQKRYTMESKVGNFSIQLPESLKNIVSMKEKTNYYDKDLKCRGKMVSFVGNKNGCKMTLFTIYRLKGMYSPDDIEKGNPFMNYVEYQDGYTYTIQYSEIEDENQYKEYTDIMNKDISGILPFFEFLN